MNDIISIILRVLFFSNRVSIFIFDYINLGCGGYINGEGVIESPNENNLIIASDLADYEKYCFWFLEARNEGDTTVLRIENPQPTKVDSDDYYYDRSYSQSWELPKSITVRPKINLSDL